ncbi:MAG: hypothetical protein ACR2GD_00400 [Pyrinomonadaceae bacterium]
MIYPNKLEPDSEETLHFSSGEIIKIPKINVRFKQWFGEHIEDNYGGKAIVNFNDEPVFAELAILRIFQNDNWNGVWVDTYKRKYRTAYWNNKDGIELPSDKQILLDKIYKNLGSKNGCWDVFCWKENKVIFAESKRSSKDKIRKTQVEFLESALSCGLSKAYFLIVEWSLK